MLKIEEGKYYKTRDGRKVGPMIVNDTLAPVWYVESGELKGTWYEDDGKYGFTTEDGPSDLIAEWTDGPVVTETVTKTRIVPGFWDGVHVDSASDIGVTLRINQAHYGPDQLDAAAAVLSALAKGLRDA